MVASIHILLFRCGIGNWKWNWYLVIGNGIGMFEVKLELLFVIGEQLELIQCN